MRTFVQRLAAALLTFFALAAPASASGHHHGARPFASVRLINLPGGGTLIHVHGAGPGRAVVQSSDAIADAAVRDVDADGDLDIIASSGHGLVVWRNLGAGHFVLAPAPKHKPRRYAGPGLAPSRRSTQASGLGEQRQQLAAARSRLTTRVVPAASAAPQPATSTHTSVTRTHAGRAPPAHA